MGPDARFVTVTIDISTLTMIDTRYGRLFSFPEDDPIGKSLVAYGEWAEAEIRLLSTFIGLGSAVVDIGANVGTHTLAFSRRVGPHGSVRAFEPQRPVFEALERTLAGNGCSNVIAFHAGVGRAAGEMLVPSIDYIGHANIGGMKLLDLTHSKDINDHDWERAEIVALDDIELASCHLVKVDAEGMEGDVLAGMVGTVRRCRPVVYLECLTVDSGEEILGAMDWPNYRFFLSRTAAYNPQNYRGNADNFFGVARESSLLCVPMEASHLVPDNESSFEILPVDDLQTFAEALLPTPRYGDATSYDRDPVQLREELSKTRDAAEARIRELETRAVELEADVARLKFRADSLSVQLRRAEGSPYSRIEPTNATTLPASHGQADAAALLAIREREIAALRSSTSWRITAPLRQLKLTLLGQRGGPRRRQ